MKAIRTSAGLAIAADGFLTNAQLGAVGADAGPNANPVGVICAANEARFTTANYSQPLTAYTVGWRDPENIDQILEQFFPSVEVSRRFEFKKAINSEAFLSEADDVRPIGAAFKRVEYTGETTNEKTINKGLTVRVDHDDEPDGNFREKYVARLLQRLLRNDLRRSVALIDAAATNTARIFSSATNPDGFIRADLLAAANASGIRPNIVLMGEAAADLRLDAYEAAANTSSYAGRAAGMTLEQLAQKLMVDRVGVIKARYQSSASAKTAIVPSVVYSYLALPGASKDDPTNVKRFITPTSAGRYKVYVQEFDKFTDISVEHYTNTVITSTLGIRKITATAS
jgi:hypothetical protein